MSLIDVVEEKERKTDLDPFAVGDTVKVHVVIREGDKERIQVYKGDVIAKRGGGGLGATFTVRKISFGVGVERIFPVHAQTVKKVEVVKKGKIRRAKLYYLRQLKGKAARLKELRYEDSCAGPALLLKRRNGGFQGRKKGPQPNCPDDRRSR
jgi:large subunit ribosomal protein L19